MQISNYFNNLNTKTELSTFLSTIYLKTGLSQPADRAIPIRRLVVGLLCHVPFFLQLLSIVLQAQQVNTDLLF